MFDPRGSSVHWQASSAWCDLLHPCIVAFLATRLLALLFGAPRLELKYHVGRNLCTTLLCLLHVLVHMEVYATGMVFIGPTVQIPAAEQNIHAVLSFRCLQHMFTTALGEAGRCEVKTF